MARYRAYAAAAVALLLTAPTLTHAEVDIPAMKAHQTPAPDSVEAARVCAAATYIYAIAKADDDVDGDYQDLSDGWARIAAVKVGVAYDHYIWNELTDDGLEMKDIDKPTIGFYEDWCLHAFSEAATAAGVQVAP